MGAAVVNDAVDARLDGIEDTFNARLEGCQKSEKEERERNHARFEAIERGLKLIGDDLTFLRGRMSGVLVLLAGAGALGGIVSAILGIIKAATQTAGG